MRLLATLLFISLALSLKSAAAATLLSEPVFGGYLKSLNVAYQAPPGSSLENGFFSANRQRVDLKGYSLAGTRLEISLENLLLYSKPPGQVELPGDSPNRTVDLETEWNRGELWSDRLEVDRLSISRSEGALDWSIGRQAIGFGRIAIFSPLDIVAPFAPDALDTDVRPGVDAARAVYYFGLGGQLGGTVVFGSTTDNTSYLATFTENRSGIDYLAIGGRLRSRNMIGLGAAGSIGPLGLKLEGSYYNGRSPGEPGGDLHEQFTIAATELWYRFENDLVLLAEYLYNGAGTDEPTRYPAVVQSAAYQEGLTFLLGRHYLLLGPSWEYHPLVTMSGLVIWNLEDSSFLFRPTVQASLSDNLSLDLFYSFNVGQEPSTGSPIPVPVLRSEFGSAGDSGGFLLRWFF